MDPRATIKVVTWLLGAAIAVLITIAVVDHRVDTAILALLLLPFFLIGPVVLLYSRRPSQGEKPTPTLPRFSRAAAVVFGLAAAGVLVNILASTVAPTWEGWFWLQVVVGAGFCISVVAWALAGLLRWWRRRKSDSGVTT